MLENVLGVFGWEGMSSHGPLDMSSGRRVAVYISGHRENCGSTNGVVKEERSKCIVMHCLKILDLADGNADSSLGLCFQYILQWLAETVKRRK